jgi:macrolide transport system ATP-binding/permease protein
MVLSVDRISIAFGPSTVLDGVSFVLGADERVGLVGANGSGKSTLLRIIAGELDPDAGRIRLGRGVEIGHLYQEPPGAAGSTIDELIRGAVGDLGALERRLRELEAEMGTLTGAELDAVLDAYGLAAEQFERRGGYDLDHRVDAVLAGLGLGQDPRDRTFATLSGGEKARAMLAALLLRAPDLLLLDEPTNHLDARAAEWLEGYLASYRGAILAVSHDRHFLNRTVTKIVELDEHTHGAREYAGNYDAYRASKLEEQGRGEREYERQQEEIRELRRVVRTSGRQVSHNRPPTDNDKFARHFFRERVEQAVSRNVRAAEERLRRIEADPAPKQPRPLRINPDFAPDELRSDYALRLEGVRKVLGGRTVLRDVTLAVGRRERIVLLGENGAGKSTLLSLLAGRLQPDVGTVRIASGARIGYLDQDAASLDPDRTLLEEYRADLDGPDDQVVNDLFSYGLFTRDDLTRPVRHLSLGQRRKLQVAKLIAARANVFLLDEPTNHLSLDVLEKLEEALAQFPGPIVAVSHDRWFVERFGGAAYELRDGRLTAHTASAALVLVDTDVERSAKTGVGREGWEPPS